MSARVNKSRLRGLLLVAAVLLSAVTHAAEKTTYFHFDALGSPVVATDQAGNVVWKEEYRPYGARIKQAPAAASNTRWYTGHPHDNDTGLTYMGARYYDPIVGRFMAIDPKGFDENNIYSFNRYAYANNNPYKFVDPDGRAAQVLVPAAGVVLLVGGAIYIAINPEARADLANLINQGGENFNSNVRLLGRTVRDLIFKEGDADDRDTESSGNDRGDRAKNRDNPIDKLDSIGKQQQKRKKPGSRPSIQSGDFEGARRRPKQETIRDTSKSEQNARIRPGDIDLDDLDF